MKNVIVSLFMVLMGLSMSVSAKPLDFALGASGLAESMAPLAMVMDQQYFEIESIQTSPVTEGQSHSQFPSMLDCSTSDTSAAQGRINGAWEVSLDEIINTGKKIWSVIVDGKPVVNIHRDVAHALPHGITCWSELEGWQIPRSQVYRSVYINKLKQTVVDFTYRVSYIAGGQYQGKGHYILQATVAPAEIYVAWGFTFDVTASVPAVFNMGTRENPVAGLQLNLQWILDTTVNRHEVEEQFFVNGLGVFQKMQAIDFSPGTSTSSSKE